MENYDKDELFDLDQRHKLFENIARRHLMIPTLQTRKSDRLDFHEVAVWSVKWALEEAYKAGQDSNTKRVESTSKPNTE